jgi:hypothetical protein
VVARPGVKENSYVTAFHINWLYHNHTAAPKSVFIGFSVTTPEMSAVTLRTFRKDMILKQINRPYDTRLTVKIIRLLNTQFSLSSSYLRPFTCKNPPHFLALTHRQLYKDTAFFWDVMPSSFVGRNWRNFPEEINLNKYLLIEPQMSLFHKNTKHNTITKHQVNSIISTAPFLHL